MSNKVQRFFVLDSTGSEHDVVARYAFCTFDHGNLLVQFTTENNAVIAAFLNPICYSTYETEK